jgi:Zn-dependent protease with chaperone function
VIVAGEDILTTVTKICLVLNDQAALVRQLVAPAQAQAYIHNPLNELRGGRNASMARLFSTHPATEERIARLRAMSPQRV